MLARKARIHDGANRTTVSDLRMALTVELLPTPTAVQGRNATSGRSGKSGKIPNSGTTLQDWAWLNAGRTWGKYRKAIAIHASILRCPPPAPIEPAKNGTPRVTTAFVEWMMMLPAGHVTEIPISRTQQLKALGNGVVPLQAAVALRVLAPHLARHRAD